MVTTSLRLSPNHYLDTLTTMLRVLYDDDQLTDLTLHCRGGTVRAHKLILAAASSYFRRILIENEQYGRHLTFIMHGVTYEHLHQLIELIYKGCVEVPQDSLDAIYKLADELEIPAALLQPPDNTHDTRLRGNRRITGNYEDLDGANVIRDPSTDGTVMNGVVENSVMVSPSDDPNNEQQQKVLVGTDVVIMTKTQSTWAKKQRKFKCAICPSSFKRASHLTRHQLVHTGERPYACNQCDKAFSRPDKLKNHVKKTHDFEHDGPLMRLAAIGEVTTSTPNQQMALQENLTITHPTSSFIDESSITTKRGRGRPRKHPIVVKPLIKRGRGRPRLHPVEEKSGENFDITNLPYGDLNYLTMPIENGNNTTVMLEPFVEIKTEPNISDNVMTTSTTAATSTSPLCNQKFGLGVSHFENKIAKIGECTISVANH